MTEEGYLSPKDIAERLGVSLSTAYKVVSQCSRVKFGKNVRVSTESFAQWLANRTVEPRSASRDTRSAEPRIKPTRWPDGVASPPRKPKPVVGRPRPRPDPPDVQDRPLIRPTRQPT